jgi:hypothetical protein
MLYVAKEDMTANTFEQACLIAFSKMATVSKVVAMTGMGMGTIEVESPVEQACGAWDWNETVSGFRFVRA